MTNKNIVLCFDGTGNVVRAEGNTNVIRLFKRLTYDPERQLTYYDPGVGTFSSGGAWTPVARWISRTLGLAFGSGMRDNLEQAYTFLINNWNSGDNIYLFGFSRGAYTARAMAGLLRTVGILRPGADNLVRYAVGNYARRRSTWHRQEWKQSSHFGSLMSRRTPEGTVMVPVEYLGLWDTVKAPGLLRRSMNWPYTRQLPNVRKGRHAISIDEKRRPYREYQVDEKAADRIEEVWFAGVHSDVGGSYMDPPALGEITLNWIAQGAKDAGLLFDEESPFPLLTPQHATGPIHKANWVWAFTLYRRRPIPAGAKVHDSVRARIEKEPGYAKHQIPRGVRWAQPDWLQSTTQASSAATCRHQW